MIWLTSWNDYHSKFSEHPLSHTIRKIEKKKKAPLSLVIRTMTYHFSSVQFSRLIVSKSLDPMDGSTPGFPVHYQLLEFSQTHLHQVNDAIQPSHPLSSPYPTNFNLSQHQGLFKWVSSLHQVAKVLEFQIQHLSFQWTFRADFL